jgi:hypothetical protein
VENILGMSGLTTKDDKKQLILLLLSMIDPKIIADDVPYVKLDEK